MPASGKSGKSAGSKAKVAASKKAPSKAATKAAKAASKRGKEVSKRGITKASIRKIARRGGCKRIASSVYDEARTILRSFVDNLMHDTGAIMEMFGKTRSTVRPADVMFALKKQGRTLYAVA
eukprot:TRINITY_DN395_c0_g1_i1.p2 TRINITY_DN395_c0_g1~~TRINITY_DN395_c0_g1_i1.p2  ORF type:complete len:122 (+),score=66.44 TRINITY_DN395_c0_g1_i1:70-435(+)